MYIEKYIEINIIKERRQEVSVRRKNALKSLKLISEQIQINQELYKKKIVTRLEILKLLREKSSLQSRIDEDVHIIKSLNLGINKLKNEKVIIKTGFKEEIQKKININTKKLLENQQLYKTLLSNLTYFLKDT